MSQNKHLHKQWRKRRFYKSLTSTQHTVWCLFKLWRVCDVCMMCVCSEGIVAVWRERLQFAGDSSVHLRPEVSGHSSAGNHPWEEHGDPAPAPNQQVLNLIFHTVICISVIWITDRTCRCNCFFVFRILGNRVAELENKLKTLEMSGLWSLPGEHKYLNLLRLLCLSEAFILLTVYNNSPSLSSSVPLLLATWRSDL